MRCYDVIKQIMPRMGEGKQTGMFHTPWKQSTRAGQGHRFTGKVSKVQLIVSGIRVFSFLEGKTLATEITITQGREQRSDIQIIRPLHNVFYLDISHLLQIHLPSVFRSKKWAYDVVSWIKPHLCWWFNIATFINRMFKSLASYTFRQTGSLFRISNCAQQ